MGTQEARTATPAVPTTSPASSTTTRSSSNVSIDTRASIQHGLHRRRIPPRLQPHRPPAPDPPGRRRTFSAAAPDGRRRDAADLLRAAKHICFAGLAPVDCPGSAELKVAARRRTQSAHRSRPAVLDPSRTDSDTSGPDETIAIVYAAALDQDLTRLRRCRLPSRLGLSSLGWRRPSPRPRPRSFPAPASPISPQPSA